MSDQEKQNTEEPVQENQSLEEQSTEAPKDANSVQLNGLYAFKIGMSSVFNEAGKQIPVTVLQYKPWIVSQIKTKDKDGYEAVQIACDPKKDKNSKGSERGHLKGTSFEHGARFLKEIRQDLPEGIKIGQRLDLDTLNKGDKVKLTSKSKGRGFAGVVKRWNFGGGRASHGGSATLRSPGSIGNCTFPGRVMKGRKMGGQFGNETTTLKNVQIVDVLKDENVVLVKGAVPGSRNSLVKLMKA